MARVIEKSPNLKTLVYGARRAGLGRASATPDRGLPEACIFCVLSLDSLESLEPTSRITLDDAATVLTKLRANSGLRSLRYIDSELFRRSAPGTVPSPCPPLPCLPLPAPAPAFYPRPLPARAVPPLTGSRDRVPRSRLAVFGNLTGIGPILAECITSAWRELQYLEYVHRPFGRATPPS